MRPNRPPRLGPCWFFCCLVFGTVFLVGSVFCFGVCLFCRVFVLLARAMCGEVGAGVVCRWCARAREKGGSGEKARAAPDRRRRRPRRSFFFLARPSVPCARGISRGRRRSAAAAESRAAERPGHAIFVHPRADRADCTRGHLVSPQSRAARDHRRGRATRETLARPPSSNRLPACGPRPWRPCGTLWMDTCGRSDASGGGDADGRGRGGSEGDVFAGGGVSSRPQNVACMTATSYATAAPATALTYSRAHLVLKIFSPTARLGAGASANEAMAILQKPSGSGQGSSSLSLVWWCRARE